MQNREKFAAKVRKNKKEEIIQKKRTNIPKGQKTAQKTANDSYETWLRSAGVDFNKPDDFTVLAQRNFQLKCEICQLYGHETYGCWLIKTFESLQNVDLELYAAAKSFQMMMYIDRYGDRIKAHYDGVAAAMNNK